MAEGQEPTGEGVASPSEPEQVAADKIPTPASGAAASGRPTLWLAAVLGLVLAGIVLSPFWAPEIAPLLPWGEKPAAPMPDYTALAARLDAIERRPVAPRIDVDAIKSNEDALARRVDQLESASRASRPDEAGIAANKAGLQQLEQRVSAIEAQSASRATNAAGDIQKLQQEVARLGSMAADLSDRLPTLERQLRAQAGAGVTDAALLLALLQMRAAVEQARPFDAEFAAFTTLAHDRPDLVAAAGPLAEAARDGVPDRSVLVKRLAELAGRIATAQAPPAATDWGTQALVRLRSLVTIRRIDGAAQSGPEAAVSAAERALERGDLGDAVAQLDRLAGANAAAAADWLGSARRRLAAEAALAHLQELLLVRLGHPPEVPGSAPASAPAKSQTPS